VSKLFQIDNKENPEENVNLSFSDVMSMEEHELDLNNDILSLENSLEIYALATETVAMLEKDVLSLESGDLSNIELNAINSRYITACANTGCEPIDVSNEDVGISKELAAESISDIVAKMIATIKVLISKIVTAMKKVYAKILITFNNDEKKAKLLLADFKKFYDEEKDIDSTTNWRLSDDTRNSLYRNLAAFFAFKEDELSLNKAFIEFVKMNSEGGLSLDKDFKTLNDVVLKVSGILPLTEDINSHISNKIEDFVNSDHHVVSINGASFGVVSMTRDDADVITDIKYTKHTLLGKLGGQQVKTNVTYKGLNQFFDLHFKIVPDLDLRTLAELSNTVAKASSYVKDIYGEQTKATKKMEAMLKDIEDTEQADVLKKVIMIEQQIAMDKMLGFLQMNKAMLRLLNKQSYNFK
jgi:hypothetical protein